MKGYTVAEKTVDNFAGVVRSEARIDENGEKAHSGNSVGHDSGYGLRRGRAYPLAVYWPCARPSTS